MVDVARELSGTGRNERLPVLARANSVVRTRHEPLVCVFAAAAFGMIFDRYGNYPAIEGWLHSATVFALWSTCCACTLVAWFAISRVGRYTTARNAGAAWL